MSFFKKENNLIWQYNGETVVIQGWGIDSLRVTSVPMGEICDEKHALSENVEKKSTISIEKQTATIQNGKIKAVIYEHEYWHTGRISFYNEKGELLLREIPDRLRKSGRKFKSVADSNYQLTVSFESDEDEILFGMGQYQQEIMNIKGCQFELAHRNSQVSIPFVMSNLGYGFLWNNPAIGRAVFGKNHTEWVAESTDKMDYWITAGDTPKDIEENFANVVGKSPMMPEYGLGFWQCKLRYYNQEELLNVAREYKKKNIPIDVIVCDFFHWPKMGDFRFDEEFFPNLKEMVDELKKLNIELMVSVWPQISMESENFNQMKEEGLLVKSSRGVDVQMRFGGDSVFFDATNPKAREYVWNKCKKNYYDYGIKTFWLDEAEPEYETYDFDNYMYHKGSALKVSNIYPKMFSKTFFDGLVNEGEKEIVNLVRCAWVGSQKYGALVWSGDIESSYEDFRKQICAGLHMGICGIPWWTTDIGGFFGGNPDNEEFRKLLVRWFQYGTFCPVMRLHGDRMPWTRVFGKDGIEREHTGGNNEVWSYGEEVEAILISYINLRERMKPYTSRLMKEAHEHGSPVMRTMFYEFPNDKICWSAKEQYMFGNDMLIAPIAYEDMYERDVYLPIGVEWENAWTGEKYNGGQYIKVSASLDVIPVFLRDGNSKEYFI